MGTFGVVEGAFRAGRSKCLRPKQKKERVKNNLPDLDVSVRNCETKKGESSARWCNAADIVEKAGLSV